MPPWLYVSLSFTRRGDAIEVRRMIGDPWGAIRHSKSSLCCHIVNIIDADREKDLKYEQDVLL